MEEFDVFYDSDQIQATQVQQKADLFEEIVTQINQDQKKDPQSQNLVQILQYVPKVEKPDEAPSARDLREKAALALIQKERDDHVKAMQNIQSKVGLKMGSHLQERLQDFEEKHLKDEIEGLISEQLTARMESQLSSKR